jgi:tRNA dimethylallyltransferase
VDAPRPRLVVIVGPTGAGKTRLSLDLARRAGGEVVSCDSQQVYRGMDIGTGKVSAAERAEIPHYGLDVIDPDEEMTAARFAALADAAVADVAARDRPVIVCGGTMLYVRILMYGLFDAPPADPALRAALGAIADAEGTAALWARLHADDPEMAAKIDPNDRKRLIRALEVQALTGVPMSEHQRRHDFRTLPRRYEARLVGLAPPRDELYRRIDARVQGMFDAGLVDEVRALRAAGYAPPLRSQEAIGYGEVHAHLAGEIDLPTAIARTQQASRHYARRQLSWYRSDQSVEWSPDPAAVDLDSLERYLRPGRDTPG